MKECHVTGGSVPGNPPRSAAPPAPRSPRLLWLTALGSRRWWARPQALRHTHTHTVRTLLHLRHLRQSAGASLTVLRRVDEGADAERTLALTVEGLHLHLEPGGRRDFGVFVDVLPGLWVGDRHSQPLGVVLRLEGDDVAEVTAVVVL